MFNANTNEQTTHDPSWVSWEVPAGHSTTPQDPTLPTSQHGPQRSAAPPDKNDPGICDQRGPRVASMAGNTQHRMECVTSHSLLASGKPCGNARGRLVREGRFQPLVTLLSGCYVYLAYSPSGQRRWLQAPIPGVRAGDGVASCNLSGGMERAYLHAPAKEPTSSEQPLPIGRDRRFGRSASRNDTTNMAQLQWGATRGRLRRGGRLLRLVEQPRRSGDHPPVDTVRDSLLGNCRAQIVFFTMEKGLSSLESRRSARTCGQGLDPAGASALHALRRRGFLHGLRVRRCRFNPTRCAPARPARLPDPCVPGHLQPNPPLVEPSTHAQPIYHHH